MDRFDTFDFVDVGVTVNEVSSVVFTIALGSAGRDGDRDLERDLDLDLGLAGVRD